ncbi:MAG: hypothetical protein F6J86_22685 [Symploca sp. SIO1B1]|nr:hypothetical protein [Symploca sp. SIO1B1]
MIMPTSGFYKLPELDLSDIDIEAVINYVTSHGWKPSKNPSSHLLIFDGPLDNYGEPIRLVLPRNHNYTDVELRITEAIDLLANVEERDHEEILESLKEVQKQYVSH